MKTAGYVAAPPRRCAQWDRPASAGGHRSGAVKRGRQSQGRESRRPAIWPLI